MKASFTLDYCNCAVNRLVVAALLWIVESGL